MRKRPLLWFACVFLCGLAYERYSHWVLCIVPIVFIGTEIYFGVSHKLYLKSAGRSILLLSAFLFGMMHMEAEESFRARYMTELESNVEKDIAVLVCGEIIEIKHTDYGVRMRLSDCYVCLKEAFVPCNDVLVYASSTNFQVGEIHKMQGKRNIFEHARNLGGFDNKIFYQSQKIDFAIWLEQSELLSANEDAWKSWLYSFKNQISDVMEACMDEETSGFFVGMLLGDKSSLESELKDLFTIGGISHILAISGLHVSMIGNTIYRLLRRCGLQFAGAGIIAGVVLLAYGYLVGNGMSAVRAIGMMFLFFLSQCAGRGYDMLNALGAMMIVLLWNNPFLLEYSGFWFSVMALVGVGFVGSTFAKTVSNCGYARVQGLVMSLGITLSTLPIVAFSYYEIPLYAPLVNAIVLPILTPIFILALCGSLVGLCSYTMASLIFFPCEAGLKFYVWLCEVVSKLPGSSFICGVPEKWVVVVYYIVLFCGGIVLQRLTREKNADGPKIGKWYMLIVCVICILLMIYPKDKPHEITFLDVGQGDAVYIGTEECSFFIDGGSSSQKNIGEYCILPFLKSKGISKIDYWFISHADADHISGVAEVLTSGYKVKYLVVSKHAPKEEGLLNLISLATLCDVQMIYMDAGEKIMSNHAVFTCLYPWDSSEQDKNDASLVLELELDVEESSDVRAFFAGDISARIEQMLLEKEVVDDVWLYKVIHHGSKHSNSLALLEVLRPEISVVSCSSGNLYGHPHEEAIARIEMVGSELLHTMEKGQVTIVFEQ